jgi:hypothetical protein
MANLQRSKMKCAGNGMEVMGSPQNKEQKVFRVFAVAHCGASAYQSADGATASSVGLADEACRWMS